MAEEGVPPSVGLSLGGGAEEEEEEWSAPTTLPHITNWVRRAAVRAARRATYGPVRTA
jgi:hypothetical protein